MKLEKYYRTKTAGLEGNRIRRRIRGWQTLWQLMLNMSCLDSRHYVSISFKSVRYDRRAEGVSAESDVQNVSVSERKHKVFFPMDVLLGRVIHVVFCL
ncbi:hypothetical protein NXV26_18915 [Bacteroides fragilis]|nr:hypothetical protein [Bacteroides fragilis]